VTAARAAKTATAAPLAVALLGAARVVAAVCGGRTLDDALAADPGEGVLRAATRDLAYGALRRYGLGDFLLARLMQKPPQDANVRGLLLAALYRLAARPEDAHTTVDQAVTAAAGLARGKYRGLVNGVLRNALRRGDELAAAVQDDPVACWQHPAWWLAKLRAAYPDHWQAIAAAGNDRPPMTLRVNGRHGSATAYQAELAAAGVGARALDDTAVRLAKPVAVESLPGFADGRVSVQDWGAQRAAALLDARAGMRVLDACAAPGGKTAHLLERGDGLDLTALDADAGRAVRVGENLARLALSAEVKVADCRRLADWWDNRPFERILADVPCSASGVVRRHPDIKWLRRPGDIAGFAASQCEILDALWQVLAPGGKMLYATCSLFPEENGAQVAAFVARHADAHRLPTGADDNEWQLVPDADQDGFYYALLAKR
jgi:16S rRNA (cytosine967-C5)-methyltransferase